VALFCKNYPRQNQTIMKQLKTTLLKGLLVIILFTGGALVLNTSGVQTLSQAKAATYNQVGEYLTLHGYTIISLEPKSGTRHDWTAVTCKDGKQYITTINCTYYDIVGHCDVPM
jgi:hypothetical protein